MSVIVPAILPTSRQDLEDKLARIHGLATDVQVDVVDGRYVSPPSWPYSEEGWQHSTFFVHDLPYLDDLTYEADVMAEDPAGIAGAWIDAGARRIVFHATSSPHILTDISNVQARYGHDKDFAPDLLSIGIALNTTDSLALIEPFLSHVDFVQFMGVTRIGLQGEPFDRHIIEKIRAFRRAHPGLQVQVDGGVSLDVAPALLSAGVSRLVVGSALWRSPDPRAAFQHLAALAERYGVFE